MTTRRRWRAALWAALLTGCAAGPGGHASTLADAGPSRPYVIVLSFDAFRHDYLARHRLPAFAALAARGMRARALVPGFPSKTFPSHYSIATGLHPGQHGIVGNAFFDPEWNAVFRAGDTLAVREGRWYGGEPIWVTAERNGVRSATYYWPGSEAEIGGVRPAIWRRYDARIPATRRVDEAAGWLRLPPAMRPHLVMMYFSEVDDTTHRYGPDTPQGALAVAGADRVLQRLLDSLAVLPIRDSVNVVVLSDHGMSDVSRERTIPVLDALARAGVDTSGILASDNGPTMSLWFRGDTARLERARSALASSLPHTTVYRRGELPSRLHAADNARLGDLLLVAERGWELHQRSTDRMPRRGAHGYDPAEPEMHGIFIAAGPGVRPAGVVPAFENVNVYGILAALLRLERLPRTDGTGVGMEWVK